MRRTLRALFIALRLTLRGEIPQPSPLASWLQQGRTRLTTVRTVAAAQGIDPANVTLRIDRRDITMKTILDTVGFHLEDEYPHLLRRFAGASLAVISASNMDDHYRLIRLEAAPPLSDTPVQQAVAALSAHLQAIPRPDDE